MGYVRGVMHGMVIGTAIGVCIAPQEGTRTRAQIGRAVEQARSVVPRAQGAARSVAGAAVSVRDTVEKFRHREESEPYVSVNGSGNGSSSD
jgi:gas vesicle protein